MSPKNFLVAMLLAIALVLGVFTAMQLRIPAEMRTAFVFPAPTDLPQFSLFDQNGAPVTAATFRGQWDLVFFGFTNCPDVCPATLQILSAAKREIDASNTGFVPRIVLVSVDPERDTPEALAKYLNYFGAGHLGVTGELLEVSKLTSALGIYFEKQTVDGDTYNVDHSAAVLVFNPDGQFHALFSAPHVIANYVHDLKIIMAGG